MHIKNGNKQQLKKKITFPLFTSADSKSRAITPFLGAWLGQHCYFSLSPLPAEVCNNVSLCDQLHHEILDFTEYTEITCRTYHPPHLATVPTCLQVPVSAAEEINVILTI